MIYLAAVALPIENDLAHRLERKMIEGVPGMETWFAEDADIKHYFAPQQNGVSGLYARSHFRKAGVWVVGHAHRHSDMAILTHGRLLVFVDGKVREIVGPSEPFVTSAGSKKVTYAVEDSTLITFHPTNETDLERVEDAIFIKSQFYQEYEAARRLTDPEWNRAGKRNIKEIN
jgi:hypothetical protein